MTRKKAKKKVKKKPGEAALKMSAHFQKIANAPLKKKGTSDAWNERQNRLAAQRDATKLKLRGTMEKNKAKAKAKKKRSRGSKSSK